MINRARSRACSGESVVIGPSVTVRFVREPRMRKLTMYEALPVGCCLRPNPGSVLSKIQVALVTGGRAFNVLRVIFT